MTQLQLSTRLTTVAKYIQEESFLADIGSDHAYLPVYCVQRKKAKKAIAGEVVKGPFESATSTVLQYGLSHQITVRLGDGLDVLMDDAVDHITICGMGGQLIRDILERGKSKLEQTKRLILQPNVAAHYIRKWAYENGWVLICEEILKEDEKIYEILVLEKKARDSLPILEELDMIFGPFLRKEKSDVFLEKWQREHKKLVKVRESIQNAPKTPENLTRLKEIKQEIQRVEEVLSV